MMTDPYNWVKVDRLEALIAKVAALPDFAHDPDECDADIDDEAPCACGVYAYNAVLEEARQAAKESTHLTSPVEGKEETHG